METEKWKELWGQGCGEGVEGRGLRRKGCGDRDVERTTGGKIGERNEGKGMWRQGCGGNYGEVV